MSTSEIAPVELSLLIVTSEAVDAAALEAWRADADGRIALRCDIVADATAARSSLEAIVETGVHALVGLVQLGRSSLGSDVFQQLDRILDRVADGDHRLACIDFRLPIGSDAIAGLLATLLDDDALPSAVAPAPLWRTALYAARGGPTAAVGSSLFEAMDSFVILEQSAQGEAPNQGRPTTTADVERSVSDASDLVGLLATALELTRLAVPGWLEHGTGVCDLLLRSAVRMPELDRSLLASELRRLKDQFDPRDDRSYSKRSRDIIEAVRAEGGADLEAALQTRLLVVGHDLKFIDFIYDYLPGSVQLREDRWTGEKRHDVAASQELAAWADVIWVEWLAYSALWYSRAVRDDQILIVRQHRYELLRDVGEQIDYERVSAVIAIAIHTLEGVRERFDVPREKLRLLPNIYEADRYTQADAADGDRQFRLALVGSVPRLKGLHRAIEILSTLRALDARYTLTVFGRRAGELPWVRSNPEEAAYFEACEQYLRETGLEEAVQYAGWVDIRRELHRYGYVLSTSDLEGSHVSPGEAYLTGNLGLYLRWRGAEYIYPERFGFDSPSDLARYISTAPLGDAEVVASVRETASRLATEQGVSAFLAGVQTIIHECPL